jgi:VanZ family protein
VLPLHFARFWAALGWLGVGLGVLLTVLPSGSAPVPIGGHAQHLAGYFMLTSWFLGLYPPARYPLIALSCLLYGGGMELLQNLSPSRHPALADALTNGVGILAALIAAYAGLGGWAARVEKLLGASRR